jgi:inorganic pyrophosphatase
VPETLGEDGDPLDALVLGEEPTFPGCHIRVRPVGVFQMQDEAGPDAKLICVPATDPRWNQVQELHDLSTHLLSEIAHFFDVYKELEPGKRTETAGWHPRPVAEQEVEASRRRFRPRV